MHAWVYATDKTLFYGTGGVVFGDIDTNFSTGNGANTITFDDDTNDVGFQVGGGAEYRLTQNVSLSLEYLYTSFGDDDSTTRIGPPADNVFSAINAAGTNLIPQDNTFDYHTVQFGMKYRF